MGRTHAWPGPPARPGDPGTRLAVTQGATRGAAWSEQDGEFADKMNAMPKHVATSATGELGWNATALHGDVPAAVAELKKDDGGPILVAGSATLVRTLLSEGDELRLMVFPVLVGGGISIFPADRGKLPLELAELVRYDSGVLLQVYRKAEEPVPSAG